jgi:phenylacetate-CoA ligase
MGDLSRDELLIRTVERAREAPFFAEHLAGVQVTGEGDLADLPLLYKSHMQDRPADAFLAVGRDRVWHYHESFGTTGPRVYGWYSLNDFEAEIPIIRVWMEAFGPGKTIINRLPYAFPVPSHLAETGARLTGGCLLPAGNMNFNVGYRRVLELIERLGVTSMVSFPLEPVQLAELARLQGKDPATDFPAFKNFNMAGRLLAPSLRRSIEAQWGGARIRNLYGCTEGGPFATSCTEGHLHLHDDHFAFEILDPDTQEPVPPGSNGILVATTFRREAQPMVRYWTGDIVRTFAEPCPCGRKGRKIEVLGRHGDELVWEDRRHYPYDIEETILQEVTRLDSNIWFSIVTKRGLLVRIEARDRASLQPDPHGLAEKLGMPVRIELCQPSDIVNHVALLTQARIFKPFTLCDWRTSDRKVINLSGGSIDWWADFTPKILWMQLRKGTRDFFYRWWRRLVG